MGKRFLFSLGTETIDQQRIFKRTVLSDLRLRSNPCFADFKGCGKSFSSISFERRAMLRVGIYHVGLDGKAVPCQVVGLLSFEIQYQRKSLFAWVFGIWGRVSFAGQMCKSDRDVLCKTDHAAGAFCFDGGIGSHAFDGCDHYGNRIGRI